jgi:hypothetical protein
MSSKPVTLTADQQQTAGQRLAHQIASGAKLRLTPELSKRARRELGMSQNDVIKATGIKAYALKFFEAERISRLEFGDAEKLIDFYETKGVNLTELAAYVGQVPQPRGAAGNPTPVALQDGFTYTPRPGFMISDQLAPELVDKLMERMETNDDRIGELTAAAFQSGFLGGISEDTEAKARELIGALAENHVIFRFLQGRNIIAPTRDEPKTLGNFLAQWMQESPALPLIAGEAPQQPSKTAKASSARQAPAEVE